MNFSHVFPPSHSCPLSHSSPLSISLDLLVSYLLGPQGKDMLIRKSIEVCTFSLMLHISDHN